MERRLRIAPRSNARRFQVVRLGKKYSLRNDLDGRAV
jgi:hypothetical protein